MEAIVKGAVKSSNARTTRVGRARPAGTPASLKKVGRGSRRRNPRGKGKSVSKKDLQAAVNRLQQIRLRDEVELQSFLENTFNAPTVYELLRQKDRLDRAAWITLKLEGVDCPLSESYGAALYRLCREVLEKLGLQGLSVEFFVTQSNDINAFAHYSHVEKKPHAIVLASELVERLPRDSVRKVIGHELGHLLFGEAVLQEVIRAVYPNRDRMPSFLKGVVDYWSQLSEMSADRLGLIAVGRMEPAIEAMFCLSSGLSLSRLDLGHKDYIRLANQQIKKVRKNEELYSQSHPLPAMRIKALSIFHESKVWNDLLEGRSFGTDETLERKMEKILSILKRNPSHDVTRASVDFLASAGSLVMSADKEATPEEFDNLVNTLSSYCFWPTGQIRTFLGGPRKKATATAIMKKSAAWIEKNASDDRGDLFDSLVEVMLRDRKVDDREVRVLRDIGTKYLKLIESEVAGRMLEGIQDRFVPLRG